MMSKLQFISAAMQDWWTVFGKLVGKCSTLRLQQIIKVKVYIFLLLTGSFPTINKLPNVFICFFKFGHINLCLRRLWKSKWFIFLQKCILMYLYYNFHFWHQYLNREKKQISPQTPSVSKDAINSVSSAINAKENCGTWSRNTLAMIHVLFFVFWGKKILKGLFSTSVRKDHPKLIIWTSWC